MDVYNLKSIEQQRNETLNLDCDIHVINDNYIQIGPSHIIEAGTK